MHAGSLPDIERSGLHEPQCSIVLVNYNGRRYLRMCLRSIFDSEVKHPFEVVLVDNASSDGSVDMVRQAFPSVRVIQNDRNHGFARGTNQGVRAARARLVLLLNTDTLLHAGSIDAMVDFISATEDAAAVGGRLVNPDGSFQAGYAKFSTISQEILIALGLGRLLREGYPSHNDSPDILTVDWLCAACLMVRRDVFLALGGFDEEYFMYSEEVDFAYRLKRSGWKTYYLPHIQTTHFGGLSSDRWERRHRVYRGKILFYRKNYGWRREVVLRVLLGIISAAKLAVWSCTLLIPSWLQRATREWRSNWQVITTCAKYN